MNIVKYSDKGHSQGHSLVHLFRTRFYDEIHVYIDGWRFHLSHLLCNMFLLFTENFVAGFTWWKLDLSIFVFFSQGMTNSCIRKSYAIKKRLLSCRVKCDINPINQHIIRATPLNWRQINYVVQEPIPFIKNRFPLQTLIYSNNRLQNKQ